MGNHEFTIQRHNTVLKISKGLAIRTAPKNWSEYQFVKGISSICFLKDITRCS